MNPLSKETRNVQNPALGALLLWRFSVGYGEGSDHASHTPMPLIFTVLPIMMHKETAIFVKSTLKATGLRAFVDKFNESKNSKSDLVASIHPRALRLRHLTGISIALAVSSNLIKIDSLTGKIIPLSTSSTKFSVAKTVRDLASGAEKLGFWCSKLTLHEISLVLKVRF